MKNETLFEKLIAKASQESYPIANVAGNVIAGLDFSNQQITVIPFRPLLWIASATSAAATFIGFAAYWVTQASSSSAANDMYQVIAWAAQ